MSSLRPAEALGGTRRPERQRVAGDRRAGVGAGRDRATAPRRWAAGADGALVVGVCATAASGTENASASARRRGFEATVGSRAAPLQAGEKCPCSARLPRTSDGAASLSAAAPVRARAGTRSCRLLRGLPGDRLLRGALLRRRLLRRSPCFAGALPAAGARVGRCLRTAAARRRGAAAPTRRRRAFLAPRLSLRPRLELERDLAFLLVVGQAGLELAPRLVGDEAFEQVGARRSRAAWSSARAPPAAAG